MSLNNDVDAGERARALHRVVRAMHDGECPKCHKLFDSRAMQIPGVIPSPGHKCPECGFTITAKESAAALAEFAKFMEQNLVVFEEWRAERNTKQVFESVEAQQRAYHEFLDSVKAQVRTAGNSQDPIWIAISTLLVPCG